MIRSEMMSGSLLDAIPCGLGFVLVAGGALAQSYPSRPVRIVVPTAPGGGVDFIARLVAQRLSERLGQQFIVDNRAGAGGVIAMDHVAKAAPDGYTLLLGFSGPLVMTPHAEKVAYDPHKDFAGVSQLTSFHLMLATHPSLPVRSVKQLIAFAKARPGELNYASGNIWTLTHLGPELAQDRDRYQRRSHPLQGHRAGGHRRARRGSAHAVRQPGGAAAARAGETAGGAGGRRAGAREARPGSADPRRIGRARSGYPFVAGPPGARRDAGRDRSGS